MRRPVAFAVLAGAALAGCGPRLPAAPVQPIAFNHKVHAGDYEIGCTSCHVYVERAPVAGVPSMARCYGCHKFIGADKPGVKALLAAVESAAPIEWVRVYRLPDHVFFTHERHVAARLRCQRCHGEVQTMVVVRQVAPLTMGWCLECHHQKHAPADCVNCHK